MAAPRSDDLWFWSLLRCGGLCDASAVTPRTRTTAIHNPYEALGREHTPAAAVLREMTGRVSYTNNRAAVLVGIHDSSSLVERLRWIDGSSRRSSWQLQTCETASFSFVHNCQFR
jgi:hypothetical protein